MGQSAQYEQNITSQCTDTVRDQDGDCTACECIYVVQITNPIRERIAIRNGFQNAIHSFVNRPVVTSTGYWSQRYC